VSDQQPPSGNRWEPEDDSAQTSPDVPTSSAEQPLHQPAGPTNAGVAPSTPPAGPGGGSEGPAAAPSPPRKTFSLTRSVIGGAAAALLLVGGLGGFAIGAATAGDDSQTHSPGRDGRHPDFGDKGGMPDGRRGVPDQIPPNDFDDDGGSSGT
jgi:hypothetical protein